MDRITFSNMLTEARISSGVSLKDLVFGIQVMPISIYRMEKGKHSFAVEKCLPYLDYIGYSIKLSKGESVLFVHDNADLITWETQIRGAISQRAFSKSIGYNNSRIFYIETGKDVMSIDMMLKIAEVYGYTVEIVPNNQNDTQL